MKTKIKISFLTAFIVATFVICFSMFGRVRPAYAADGIPINGKYFSKYIIDYCKHYDFDKNNDNRLSKSEINRIKDITIEIEEWKSNRPVNCKGMEYFTAVEHIYLEGEKFENLKIGSFNELKEFSLYCRTGMGKISFKKAPNIEKIYVSTTKGTIKSVDVSNNRKLKSLTLHNVQKADIGNLKELEELDCDRNIDTSKNVKLETLHIVGPVKKLDISDNVNMKNLSVISKKLKTIDLSKNKKLKYIRIKAPVKNIDFSNNKDLKELEVDVSAKGIDLSENKKLKEAMIKAPVKNINLSNNKNLRSIYIKAPIKDIDFDQNKKLTDINIKAPLENLDVSKLPSLTVMELYNTEMPKMKIENAHLKVLCLKKNMFKEFDMSGMPNIEFVKINDENVEKITLSDVRSNLEYFYIKNCSNLKEIPIAIFQSIGKVCFNYGEHEDNYNMNDDISGIKNPTTNSIIVPENVKFIKFNGPGYL